MKKLIVVAMLVGCADEAERLTVAGVEMDAADLPRDVSAPPVGDLDLAGPAYAFQGQAITLTAAFATPRQAVQFAASRRSVLDGYAPVCPAALPACLDLSNPFVNLGPVNAGAGGAARRNVTVPPTAPEGPAYFQSAVVVAGAQEISNLHTMVILAVGSDYDGDGLLNEQEVNVYGTNPIVYDTDGGGVGDGDEINNGSDPFNPGDDLAGAGYCTAEFDQALQVFGEGVLPDNFYPGLTFQFTLGFGLIGGLANGDSGNWSVAGSIPNAAMGNWDDGGQPNTYQFSAPLMDGTFELHLAGGAGPGINTEVLVEGLQNGVAIAAYVSTLSPAMPVETVPFSGPFDAFRFSLANAGMGAGSPYAYAIDNFIYRGGGCP